MLHTSYQEIPPATLRLHGQVDSPRTIRSCGHLGLLESLHDACSACKGGVARGASSTHVAPPKCSPPPNDVVGEPSGCLDAQIMASSSQHARLLFESDFGALQTALHWRETGGERSLHGLSHANSRLGVLTLMLAEAILTGHRREAACCTPNGNTRDAPS